MGAVKNASRAEGGCGTAKTADAIFVVARSLLVPAFLAAVITAALMWLAYGTAYIEPLAVFLLFFVLAVSLLLGIMISALRGERQGRQRARPEKAEEKRARGEQKEGGHKTTTRTVGSGHAAPLSPQELRALPYEEYLQTQHWKRKRGEKLRAAGDRCQMCYRRARSLQVHHRTYERLGEELDMDLTVLCGACHRTFHQNRRLGR